MYRLFLHQLWYFWDMNYRRFMGAWAMFLLLALGGFRQTIVNPRLTLLQYLLGGTVAGEAVNHVVFPVGWFITLLLPALSMGDAIPQLWRKQGMQIWGTGFSRRQFACVDGLLTICVACGYWALVCGVVVLLAPTSDLLFLITLLPCIVFIQFVGVWASWLNRYAGTLLIVSWLIVTIYSSLPFNLLNLTMQIRDAPIQPECMLALIKSPVVMASCYIGWLPLSYKILE